MHPKNKPPIFVPTVYQAEMDRLSKAALMDIVWTLAAGPDISGALHTEIIAEIRGHAATIVTLREQD
jgi:hypothetical protein